MGARSWWAGPVASALLGSTVAGAATAALAQEPVPPGAAPAPLVLGPITVEGEKVARPLRETYTSVGVVTADEIEALEMRDIGDAFRRLGNVRFAPAQRGNNGISIRGINSEGVAGPTNVVRPLATFVVDGATQSFEGTRRGQRGLFDVRQVEVLRGPQSLIQGRNALAGSVVVRTNDPTYDWEAGAEGTLGTLETREAGAVLSGPILADQVAFRVAGETRDAAHDIDYDDEDLDGLDEDEYRHLRGKVLVEPARLDGRLSVLLTAAGTRDRPGVLSVNGPDFDDRDVTLPSASFEVRENEVGNYIADVGYDLRPGLRLRSVTSLTTTDVDIDTPSGAEFQRDETRDDEDVQTDLRLEIGTAESRLSGVAGAFLGWFDNDRDSLISRAGVTIQDLTADREFRNRAAFGEIRLEVLDGLTLIAGLRYDRETLDEDSTVTFLGETSRSESDTDYDALLPRLGVAYDLTANQTLALTASRGYRGGFVELTTAGEENEVDEEYLWSYELAYRSAWLDRRLQLNANVFYYDWDDQQVSLLDPSDPSGSNTVTLNAGRSEVYGGEVEGRWEAAAGLTLLGSLGVVRTDFEDFDTALGDFEGNDFPEAPRLTGSLGAVWRHRTGLFAAADASYTGPYFSTGDLANTDFRQVDSFWLVDAAVGYERARWSAKLFARNLLDEDYVTSVDETGGEATAGDPLMVGVTLAVRF